MKATLKKALSGLKAGEVVNITSVLSNGRIYMVKDSDFNTHVIEKHNLILPLPSFASQVYKWNEDFGVTVSHAPVEPSSEDIELGIRLMEEEFAELMQAILTREGNKQIVKESCDLLYVILGNLSRWGLASYFDEAMQAVIDSNNSKKQPDGTVLRRDDGKILKGEGYHKADLSFIPEND